MSAAFSHSGELNLLPSIVVETKLLRHFAEEDGAMLSEQESFLENRNYFLAQAQSHDLAGFGRATTKRMAFIKAIAEFYERRLMREVFSAELSHVPKVLQTSNGFAVHFSQAHATQAATIEAIERHLLQFSFLKDGWNGFNEIGQKRIGEELLSFLVSRYTINGFRAGMVVATSTRFPGASFGYFADQENKIESSPKWTHATYEALDKIKPFLKLAADRTASTLTPIEQGIMKWMMTPYKKIDFHKIGSLQTLPQISIETQTFDLSKQWGLDFPLFGAYSYSPDLLPLLVVDRIRPEDSDLIKKILCKFDLAMEIPERNPVL